MPYQSASNRPIDGVDLDGLEYFPTYQLWLNKLTVSVINKVDAAEKRAETWERIHLITQKKAPTLLDRVKYRTEAYTYQIGEYSDIEDISVLIFGKTTKGEDTTATDYTFAGFGILLPVSV